MKPQSPTLKILTILSSLLFLAALAMVFLYAPLEETMNYVQKVFYFHIATAWVGMLGFMAAAVAGVVYLVRHDRKWDLLEMAAIEISLVFFLITIILGSIWARPVWNTWWTWDPRLTTAAIVELVYLACLLLRQGIDDPERRARFSAVYTLVGSLSVPIAFLSIRLFRTIHPVVIGTNTASNLGAFNMTPPMLATMFFCLFTFSVVFATLLWHRVRLEQLNVAIEERQMEIL
ncbi:MAG TPA: cytochrome c biogenesis protein CcsA [Anaerolineales bacterium]|jgi:heme exporter protein C